MPDTPSQPNRVSSAQRQVQMRKEAEAIFQAGLHAVAPADAVRRHLRKEGDHLHIGRRSYDLNQTGRIVVVGAGKASAAMALAVEEILADRISHGLVSVKYGHGAPLQRIRIVEAGHPIPDANGMAAAREMMQLVGAAGPGDLILVLISGGGSALMPLPAGRISLEEKQSTSDALIRCGATIHEINTIRKHISAIKGGRLAQAGAPARMAALILSDVVGDDLDVIASGCTVPDASTYGQCMDIVERYALSGQLPDTVMDHLLKGRQKAIDETPTTQSHRWQHVYNLIVGNNSAAIQAARQSARQMGYRTVILSSLMEGETRHVAKAHTAIAREILASGNPIATPACVLSGGETTVTLKGNGRGGRNQEFALAAALAIDGIGLITVLSGGTDGTDGPTDAAGAVVDHTTVQQALRAGLSPHKHLENHDAYPLLKQMGALLMTGPTQTNVMDLHIVLVRSPDEDVSTVTPEASM